MNYHFTFQRLILACLFFYSIGWSQNLQAQACSGAPVPGNTIASSTTPCPGVFVNLSIQNIATLGTGITFQWHNTLGAIVGATNATYFTATLITSAYWCDVTCTASSITVGSTPVNISLANCYCLSNATTVQDADIYNVTLNGSSTNPLYSYSNGCINVAPGPGSMLSKYSSFLSLPPLTSLSPGLSYSFTIQQDDCDGTPYFNNRIGIWIDFNHDADFLDPGENIYTSSATLGPSTFSGTFAIPVSIIPGNTVMRVVCMEGGGIPAPCGTYVWGETEDYLIGIVSPSTSTCTTAPNPGNTLASSSGVCIGSTCSLSLQNLIPPLSPSYGFQWYNAAGSISGATNATYIATITSTDTFYCIATCVTVGLSNTSTPVTVQANVPVASSSTVNACDSYFWNSGLLFSSGIYVGTFLSTGGCDSINTLNLTIKQSTDTTLNAVSCNLFTLNGQTYTNTGNYIQTLLNAAGCDSTINLQVVIDTLNVTTNISGTTISTPSVGTYQWINCSTNTLISGATNSGFTPTASGSYAVIVTSAACVDTSKCISFWMTNTSNLFTDKNNFIYPNPNSGVFEIELHDAFELSIINNIGEIVLQKNYSKGKHIINISNCASGIYFVKINTNGFSKTYKLIKEQY